MMSAHARRSLRELTRRRARAVLTILTIAVAISGVWLFAIPGNVDASMNERAAVDALHDARLAPERLELGEQGLADLRQLPNVAALDVRTLGGTDIRIGARTQWAWLVGVVDFGDQEVNIVSVEDGALPSGSGQLISDSANLRTGRFTGSVGETIELQTSTGRWTSFDIAGRGGTLRYGSTVGDDAPVLYLNDADVQEVMGYPTPNSVDVIALDRSPTAVAAMVDGIRGALAGEMSTTSYWDVLEVWEEGTWPGSEDFDNFLVVFYVMAAIALASALVLIYTTMNTIVREQTREIGMMKAVGGTQRIIRRGYLGTALLLGSIGTIAGVILGVPLSNALMAFMSDEFGGMPVGWKVSGIALLLSVVVGLGGSALAAWPALHRAARITVREAIEDHGVVADYGLGRMERTVARLPLLSRMSQMGMRNTVRRAGRSFATAVPIGLAVATMLAFSAVLITAVDEDLNSFDLEGGDITVWNNGGRGLDERTGEIIEAVPEVEFAHQMVYSNVEFDGEHYVWGLPAVSTYDHDVIDGRWFTETEAASAANVVVIGEAVAAVTDTDVGDRITVETRRGPVDLDVVGIDGQLVNNGEGMFMPFRSVLGYEGWTAGNYWIRTIDGDPTTVDVAAEGLHRALRDEGYEIGSNLRYIARNENQAENRLIVTVVMAMGIPVVAIGLIGLVNSMTTSVLERTREIGVLRSIGASQRDLRALFRAEGLAIGIVGWLIGVPLGYWLGRLILWVLEREFHAGFAYSFPPWTVLVAFLVTVVMSLLVLRLPLRRVVRMQPGLAIRYE